MNVGLSTRCRLKGASGGSPPGSPRPAPGRTSPSAGTAVGHQRGHDQWRLAGAAASGPGPRPGAGPGPGGEADRARSPRAARRRDIAGRTDAILAALRAARAAPPPHHPRLGRRGPGSWPALRWAFSSLSIPGARRLQPQRARGLTRNELRRLILDVPVFGVGMSGVTPLRVPVGGLAAGDRHDVRGRTGRCESWRCAATPAPHSCHSGRPGRPGDGPWRASLSWEVDGAGITAADPALIDSAALVFPGTRSPQNVRPPGYHRQAIRISTSEPLREQRRSG